ncbi:hypothetical protein [Salmonella phage PS3-1]|nr:hypothetical protein [Salmonella phage PS3-1]
MEQCRICTKAQGNCPARLNANENDNNSHLRMEMRINLI